MTAATVDGVSQTYGSDAADVRVDVDGVGQVWDRAGLPKLVSAGMDSFVHTAAGIARSGNNWALNDAVGSVRTVADRLCCVERSGGAWVIGNSGARGSDGFDEFFECSNNSQMLAALGS